MKKIYKNNVMTLELLNYDATSDYALFHSTKGQYMIGWIVKFDGDNVSWGHGTYFQPDCTYQEAKKCYDRLVNDRFSITKR